MQVSDTVQRGRHVGCTGGAESSWHRMGLPRCGLLCTSILLTWSRLPPPLAQNKDHALPPWGVLHRVIVHEENANNTFPTPHVRANADVERRWGQGLLGAESGRYGGSWQEQLGAQEVRERWQETPQAGSDPGLGRPVLSTRSLNLL